jgi:hypothetical protein
MTLRAAFVALVVLFIPRAVVSDINTAAISAENAVKTLATAALSAYKARCGALTANCTACSYDACSTLQPSDRQSVMTGYGAPSMCPVGGQVSFKACRFAWVRYPLQA